MVDPVHFQHVDGVSYIGGRSRFSGVRREMQPVSPGTGENFGERLGWEWSLVVVEADTKQLIAAVGQNLIQVFLGGSRAQLAVDSGNDGRAHAKVRFGVRHALDNPFELNRERDAVVSLRTDEELDVACAVARCALQHLVGDTPEIVHLDDALGERCIHHQKIGKIRIGIEILDGIERRQ